MSDGNLNVTPYSSFCQVSLMSYLKTDIIPCKSFGPCFIGMWIRVDFNFLWNLLDQSIL